MNRKGFGLVEVLLAVVILGALAGGGWYVSSLKNKADQSASGANAIQQAEEAARKLDQQTLQEQSVISKVDLSNWKTYTNKQFGFSFDYPSNLSVGEESGLVYESEYAGRTVDEPTLQTIDINDGSAPVVEIVVPDNVRSPVFQNGAWKASFCGGDTSNIVSTSTAIVGGSSAVQVTTGPDGPSTSYCVISPHGPVLIFYYPDYESSARQILSTIKFNPA